MKNIFLFVLCLASATVFAQSGSWYSGGSIGLTSRKFKNSDSDITWRFAPEVGTFLSDNIQLGAALNLRGGSSSFSDKTVGVTLYGRRFFKVGQSFRPFVGAAMPYLSTNQKLISSGGTIYVNDSKSIGLGLNAGFGYTIAPRWVVVGSLGVLSFNRELTDLKYNTIHLGFDTLGNPFDIGIYYTISR